MHHIPQLKQGTPKACGVRCMPNGCAVRARREQGFTLVELLVVIGIIGVLAAIVIGSFGDSRARARDATRLEDMSHLMLAIEAHLGEYGTFPGEGDTGGVEISPKCSTGFRDDLINGGYFSEVPEDPREDSNCFSTGEGNDDAFFYGWDSQHGASAYDACISINRLETDWGLAQTEERYPDNDPSRPGAQYVSSGSNANIADADFNYCFAPGSYI